jgi:hypothetical protein
MARKKKHVAASNTLVIIGSPESGEVRKGGARLAQVSLEKLESNVREFAGKIGQILESIPQSVAGFELHQIEFKAEVTAKGTVALLGTGTEIGGTGGLTFTFKCGSES